VCLPDQPLLEDKGLWKAFSVAGHVRFWFWSCLALRAGEKRTVGEDIVGYAKLLVIATALSLRAEILAYSSLSKEYEKHLFTFACDGRRLPLCMQPLYHDYHAYGVYG